MAIWATGTGTPPVYGGLEDGRIATAAQDLGCCQVYAVGPVNVVYGGAAPGAVAGVMQVNFIVPELHDGDTLGISISAYGRSSSAAGIYVAQ